MKRLNDWLAQHLGNALSSMYFFYFCVVLDLIELGPVISAHSVVLWVTYISQSVIQLIALPILGAQNALQQRSHNALHDKVDDLHRKHDELRDMLK